MYLEVFWSRRDRQTRALAFYSMTREIFSPPITWQITANQGLSQM